MATFLIAKVFFTKVHGCVYIYMFIYICKIIYACVQYVLLGCTLGGFSHVFIAVGSQVVSGMGLPTKRLLCGLNCISLCSVL